jgi:hypothetical protein
LTPISSFFLVCSCLDFAVISSVSGNYQAAKVGTVANSKVWKWNVIKQDKVITNQALTSTMKYSNSFETFDFHPLVGINSVS